MKKRVVLNLAILIILAIVIAISLDLITKKIIREDADVRIQNNSAPKIIAHKGGRYWYENNFSYISDSIKDGADIIELDIRQKNENYVIKHSHFSKNQGSLSDALLKIKNSPVLIYLDIKDSSINAERLIEYVKSKVNNTLIIGSLDKNVLKSVEKKEGIIINYHCFFLCPIKTAREIKADWINPISYFVTKRKIKDIQENGFKFVPSGIENYKKLIEYTNAGAYAVSVYNVKEFKEMLER